LNIMQPSDVGLCGAVVEQAPDALIFADREGTMRLWNARAEAIFGYAAGDAIGRSLDPIIPENLRAADRRGYGEKRRRRVPCRARPTRALNSTGQLLAISQHTGNMPEATYPRLEVLWGTHARHRRRWA
jgi:PAS domain S-box-containing protein